LAVSTAAGTFTRLSTPTTKADRKARAKFFARFLQLPENHPLVRAASKSLTEEELRWFEERLLIMQRKIFEDLAWQHEAYLQGGIGECGAFRRRGTFARRS
jgi:hypothetical protein